MRLRAAEAASAVLLIGLLSSALRPDAHRGSELDTGPRAPRAPVHIAVSGVADTGDRVGASVALGLPEQASPPPWQPWVWLEGSRLRVTSDSQDVLAVAARIPDGRAIAIRNAASEPVPVRLTVRLGRGRYTVDRLLIDGNLNRIERLESVRNGADGEVTKAGRVEAGQIAIYRFVDNASRAGAAYRRAVAALSSIPSSEGGTRARVGAALRECPWLLTQARNLLPNADAGPALKAVHRALLTVGLGQSVCGNAVSRGHLGTAGRRLLDELGMLEAALVECSVAALRLTPSIRVEPADDFADGSLAVEVGVRNGGLERIASVRLGVAGPDGTRVEPADDVAFGSLSPGQAVSAKFRVRGEAADVTASVVGRVSYYRAGTPAQLRFASR